MTAIYLAFDSDWSISGTEFYINIILFLLFAGPQLNY